MKQSVETLTNDKPHVIEECMKRLQECTENNTTFETRKATTLQVFGACVQNGIGVMKSSKIAASSMGFSCQVVRRWAQEVYVDIFATLTSLEDEKSLLQELGV